MTQKQRFLTALQGGIPDVVPVSPLIHSRYAYKRLGRSDWRAVFEVHRQLGSVHYRGPIGVGVHVNLRQQWWHETEVTRQGTRVQREDIWHTPYGDLRSVDVSGTIEGDPLVGKRTEYPIKSEQDWRTYISYCEEWLSNAGEPDTSTADEAFDTMGEDGVASVGIGCVFASLGEQRGMQGLLTDLLDYPDLMREVTQLQQRIQLRLVDAFLASKSEVLFYDICWATGCRMSPKMFQEWIVPDIAQVVERVREVPGKYVGYYTLGRLRELMPAIADTRPHFVETFEPNEGDITLAEAKKLYGNRMCIMGNFDCVILARGTVDEARAEARRCLREGMEGGGYVMVTGDEVPADARWDNLRAMVEVAVEDGRYV